MGSCQSNPPVIYAANPSMEAFKNQFLALGVTQSKLTVLHQHFMKIIGSGSKGKKVVTVRQIMEYFEFGNNEFIRKAFSVLVSNKEKGTLDFRDFVLTIWNYCTLIDDFGLFVFAVYDFDGNKELDHEEAMELMSDLYGAEKKGQDFDELIARIDKQKKLGAFGVSENYFRQYCLAHPKFLQPATKMQRIMKKKIIGASYWEKKAFVQRQELCNDEFEHIKSISSRLKRQNYDKDIEVNNMSDTSSQAEARSRDEKIQKEFEEWKMKNDPYFAAKMEAKKVQEIVEEADPDIDPEEEEEKARKKSKKLKKDVPVATTSLAVKRRASLSSVGSSSSMRSLRSQKSDRALKVKSQ